MTTVTTIMVNPTVGHNDLAKTFIMVSHLNAHSSLATITYTLTTSSNYLVIYTSHCVQIYISLIHSRRIPDFRITIEGTRGFRLERPGNTTQDVP